MFLYEISAIIIYFLLVLSVGILSYRKQVSSADFIMGGRSLNYWLTAFAAQASDMSNWLFMSYPALIFVGGIFNAWAAVGLTLFMYLNWQFVAPRIRTSTEQYNSLTLSSFFESRFADSSGVIRIFTAIMCIAFYTVYIAAALTGLGILLEELFHVPYQIGILLGVFIVIPYVFIGGYRTLAWIDLFQGIFLLLVIIAVPIYLMTFLGGWEAINVSLASHHLATSLLPNFEAKTLYSIFLMACGWGLGYFGQPHIITKFMGIQSVREIPKSKWVGLGWMVLSLSAATLVGLVALVYFTGGLQNPEHAFILLVKENFHPFLVGFILCAVFAATINVMSSQVLVVASSLTEDLYKKIFRKGAKSRELLFVSRGGVILFSLLGLAIAYNKTSTIYTLVLYAWSGLGSAFGPILLISLYAKKVNKYGAWAGILTGGIMAAVWPYLNAFIPLELPAMIPAFSLSAIAIFAVSALTRKKTLVTI